MRSAWIWTPGSRQALSVPLVKPRQSSGVFPSVPLLHHSCSKRHTGVLGVPGIAEVSRGQRRRAGQASEATGPGQFQGNRSSRA